MVRVQVLGTVPGTEYGTGDTVSLTVPVSYSYTNFAAYSMNSTESTVLVSQYLYGTLSYIVQVQYRYKYGTSKPYCNNGGTVRVLVQVLTGTVSLSMV